MIDGITNYVVLTFSLTYLTGNAMAMILSIVAIESKRGVEIWLRLTRTPGIWQKRVSAGNFSL